MDDSIKNRLSKQNLERKTSSSEISESDKENNSEIQIVKKKKKSLEEIVNSRKKLNGIKRLVSLDHCINIFENIFFKFVSFFSSQRHD